MMEKTNRVYDTYRVNLDNGRLFGISLLLLILLFLAFLAGFYAGRVFADKKSQRVNRESALTVPSSSGTMALFSNLTAGTQLQRYDFYQALPKDRLTSEDLERSIPSAAARTSERRSDLVEEEPLPVRRAERTAVKQSEDQLRPSVNRTKPRTAVQRTAQKVSAGQGGQFIQVASHRAMPAAEALEHRLQSRSYPVRIVKTRINGSLYFRVRVGPYSSRAEAQSVLSRLREKEGFTAAYFCSP